jgi:hypothetical protein
VFSYYIAPSPRRWIASGVMEQLQEIVLDAYDWMIGLDLCDVAVDGCITKHHQSSLWRREGRQKPRRSGQTRDQALGGRGC